MLPGSTVYARAVRARISAWAELGAPPRVLRMIRDGVRIRWLGGRPPPPFDRGLSLASASADEREWFAAELARNLEMGIWERAPRGERRHISRIFLVPKAGPRLYRVVIDSRPANVWAAPGSCRMEGLRQLPNVLQRGDWLVAVDAADAYHHLDLHPEERRYFTFVILVDGVREYLRCVGLPFGSSQSPGEYVDLMSVPVGHLRSPPRPLRLLVYLDDVLIMARTPEAAAEARDRLASLYQRLGLSLHKTKGQFEPVTALVHLGVRLDSVAGTFGVDTEKGARLRRKAGQLLAEFARAPRRLVSKRALGSFVGLAGFLSVAIRWAQFHLHDLHTAIASKEGWTGTVTLSEAALRELRWWRDLDLSAQTLPIWPRIPESELWTDASDFGWGAVLRDVSAVPGASPGSPPGSPSPTSSRGAPGGAPPGLEARGFWQPDELPQHITAKELMAVVRALQAFGPRAAGRVLRHFEDNTAVVAAVGRMASRSPDMMAALRQLRAELERLDAHLIPEYVASEDNISDGLSRDQDRDDWKLNPRVFLELGGNLEGFFSIDRFASADNALIPRYNSRWFDTRSAGRNALAQSPEAWRGEPGINWCNPPWSLLSPLVDLLRRSGARAVVIAPGWTSAPWRPLLLDLARWMVPLRRRADLFVPGYAGQYRRVGPPRWESAAVYVRCDPPSTTATWFLGDPIPLDAVRVW